MSRSLRLAIVGFGAIGRELARVLGGDGGVRITQIVVRPGGEAEAVRVSTRHAPGARVSSRLDLAAEARPELVVECAGHDAIRTHVVPALEAGVPVILASVGALHEADRSAELEAAARRGDTSVQLVSGAIAAIDALGAARVGGLDEVTYTGRKPPRSWIGTPAEHACDLAALASPRVVFDGSAREAAAAYPKNANVAATVALAGLGLDRTRVRLIADPALAHNVHRLDASGRFGRLEMEIGNQPLPDNPKTSALAAWSLARAVRNRTAPIWS